MSDLPLKQIIEGAILAADTPLGIDHMISLFDGEQPTRADVREVLATISADCEGRGFELKEVASGFRFQVRTEYGEWVSRLWEEKPPRYSRALLETLALIAYRQPITRGDIEEVRGVTVSTNIIRTLLEREWIRVVGHRDVPGRPAIYATTRNFLDYFDLCSLDELPTLAEIRDLDRVSDELDFDEVPTEGRIIETDPADSPPDTVPDPVSDEDLDQVTERVEEISDNITNLFRGEGASGEDDTDDDAESVVAPEAGAETETEDTTDESSKSSSESNSLDSQEEAADQVSMDEGSDPDSENRKALSARFPNVPSEILDAAFQDDEESQSEDTPVSRDNPEGNPQDRDADGASS